MYTGQITCLANNNEAGPCAGARFSLPLRRRIRTEEQNGGSGCRALLIAEYKTLDRNRDQARLCEIFLQAATLVDRAAQPKKWAAFRSMYAHMCEASDPEEALHGYRDALTVFTPGEDHDSWANCTMNIGFILAPRSQQRTSQSERGTGVPGGHRGRLSLGGFHARNTLPVPGRRRSG